MCPRAEISIKTSYTKQATLEREYEEKETPNRCVSHSNLHSYKGILVVHSPSPGSRVGITGVLQAGATWLELLQADSSFFLILGR